MARDLELDIAPELVFGLVAPIGVDLDLVTEVLSQLLQEMDYGVRKLRLTSLMTEVPTGRLIADTPYIKSIQDRIAYANEVRNQLGDEALAALAISAIRNIRREEWGRRTAERTRARSKVSKSKKHKPTKNAHGSPAITDGKSFGEKPVPRQAYIIRQFKRPEEIALLRSVYGRQFIVVSAYSPQELRRRRIEERERESRGGLISEVEAHNLSYSLVSQDAKETLEDHGQNIRDAFPLGDVFIDATSRRVCETTLQRFVHLLFGDNHITPTYDEYGMYMAKSASLRSSDLSRQVGAAVFRNSGEVIALGCNEVPKAGGGTYWSGDPADMRDFVGGYDPNERRKGELLVDILNRLQKGEHLSKRLMKIDDPHEIYKALLEDDSADSLAESLVMDLLEFGRIIHAEMSAICDASRKGNSIEDATLYCTTFPCHICAKHIVASGIKKVIYLEPYPKSYASDLHPDSIVLEGGGREGMVSFDPFIGVSPFRYRDLFEKGKRKYSGGIAKKWHDDTKRPMIEIYHPSYFEAELIVVDSIKEKLEKLRARHNKKERKNKGGKK